MECVRCHVEAADPWRYPLSVEESECFCSHGCLTKAHPNVAGDPWYTKMVCEARLKWYLAGQVYKEKEKMSKLSVVLANKNRETFLPATLQAWRAQDFPQDDLEIIVVDDGSEVPPIGICETYGARLVLLSPREAKNPARAWNAGLLVANGEVLACSHCEIIPSPTAARLLYGSCVGDPGMLKGLKVWAPDVNSPDWDKGVVKMFIEDEGDIKRLGGHAVRINTTTFRLQEHSPVNAADPDAMMGNPDFWTYTTEFGGHTNHEILHRFKGFFWNNLFAMKAELWDWINYMRESTDWGMDDEDFQERNKWLEIGYVFCDNVFGYHQWHGPEFRGGSEDHFCFITMDDARLIFNESDPKRQQRLGLKRGAFWG